MTFMQPCVVGRACLVRGCLKGWISIASIDTQKATPTVMVTVPDSVLGTNAQQHVYYSWWQGHPVQTALLDQLPSAAKISRLAL